MSIENPRQEADTPRVPELSWSPSKREVYWLPEPTATNVWTLELVDESLPSDELPADAVKLRGADARESHWCASAEDLGTRLDEIAEVLDDDQGTNWSSKLGRIRAIVERETPREEPTPISETNPTGAAAVYAAMGIPDGPEKLATSRVQRQPWRETVSLVDDEDDFDEGHEQLNERNPVDEEGSPSAIAAEELAALTPPKATAAAETREEHRLTHSWGRQGLTISLSCTCGSWHRSDRRLSHAELGEAFKAWTWHASAHGHVVEHQPAQDSETEQQLQLRVGREQFAGAQRRIATLEADRERIYSELARMRAERDQLKARADEALTYIPEPGQGGWDLSPDRLDALLQKIRRALLGQPYTDAASASPVAKETGEEADQ